MADITFVCPHRPPLLLPLIQIETLFNVTLWSYEDTHTGAILHRTHHEQPRSTVPPELAKHVHTFTKASLRGGGGSIPEDLSAFLRMRPAAARGPPHVGFGPRGGANAFCPAGRSAS